jgi:hypothetical protein
VVEVEARAVLAAGDLARVGAAAHEGAHHHRVAGDAGPRGDHDPVAEAEPGVGGEALVEGDAARRVPRPPAPGRVSRRLRPRRTTAADERRGGGEGETGEAYGARHDDGGRTGARPPAFPP